MAPLVSLGMTASPARSALRGLIRAVNRNVTSVAGNRQWRDFIIASAREQPSDPQLGHDRLVLAKDLTFLINNVKHHQARCMGCMGRSLSFMAAIVFAASEACTCTRCHAFMGSIPFLHLACYAIQELLSRYNIGVDPDERNKKMVEAVAKRVGFKLPEEPKAPQQ